ncbi:hypothetical protein CABS01_16251 [Colletotrichum abscissum]|uniref:BTB domain-containing protein n=4 Tax=Colletotrichum acutatum species complex TaxID=2707335 RepID=A0A9P9X038_9PEZI|nr:uncharacterized protein CLUP02_00924 [Colletotrichum lupini]XP_060390025.1 uncharacterized protein CABS01_16251 [Colletotrichum abscissum]KAK0374007.1 hypothetical protein CLIM01_08634 [Colletotrichum limetticola]KAK1481631.1 hypothetical protein CCUS01_15989 [Colletotrichum cuscutae]KAI3529177.1 hypothetical protein CABS02_14911 [Colletotrichum abscissum]KAK1472577.1 hypothetical protein CABS01_16251 [Colletotrichum abscissum]KAK1719896.1 hypothetical protein BDP67DRAFT_392948 [Colletotri
MVSQPDSASSLTLRGPSSVVSRPSLSRTKRYNRSHVGGSSYISQNEFPVFNNSGDVEIIVKAGGHQNRYLLHRHTLTQCSGFFEASTSLEWSKAVSDGASNDLPRIGDGSSADSYNPLPSSRALTTSSTPPRKRWRYELDPGTGDGDIPMLVQKDEDGSKGLSAGNSGSLFGSGGSAVNGDQPVSYSRSKTSGHSHSSSAHSNHNFFRSVANLSLVPSSTTTATSQPLSQADQDLLRDYDNLFRIFYNHSPILDGVNIADAYVQCKSLITLADLYDALAVVGPRVDHHLLQFQSRLWKQIAKYPISYLRLGYLARSRVIFQEALIHVVGQWPAGERSLRAALPDIVLDIIEDKVDELEEVVSRVEGRLFRLSLMTARGERVTPQNNYLDWLAVSLFRQWLADNTSPPPPDRRLQSSRDGRNGNNQQLALPAAVPPLATVGRTYRTLGASSAAYLGHDECKRFLKLTPELYSRDNLRRFEKRIDELKLMARDIVRPLMGSGLELDINSGRAADGIGYLTCITVGDRDLPWHGEH